MDKETQKKFDNYIRKRGHARGTLTRLENSFDRAMGLQDAYVNLEQLEKAYRDFVEYDEHILDMEPNSSEIVDFEPRYLKLKAKYRAIIQDTNPLMTAVQKQLNETMSSFTTHQRELLETIREQSFTSVPKDEVKLPKLEIPCFYGRKSEEFQSFKDLFTNIVHKNSTISDCQKLSYLKGLLKGDAYTFIRHITITDANYKSTWQKVCKRYDQPTQVIRTFVKRFLEQPVMTSNVTQSLRRICDTSSEVIAGLKAMGSDAESRDVWLNHILISKLDEDTRQLWATKSVDTKYPSFDSLLDFIEKRCTALENCDISQKRQVASKPSHSLNANHAVTSSHNYEKSYSADSRPLLKCRKCEKNHRLSECEQYNALDVDKRKEFVATARHCFNCLGAGHSSKICKSRWRCQTCRGKHHTTLHTPFDSSRIKSTLTEPATSTNLSNFDDSPSATNSSNTLPSDSVALHSRMSLFSSPLLPTARVIIRNNQGKSVIGRVLLDSGSNGSMISESCVSRLNLHRTNARYPVSGIASKSITRGFSTVSISPYFNPEIEFEMKVFIMKNLASDLPSADPEILNKWEELNSVTLADPIDENNKDIDLVMGVGYFLRILRAGQMEGPNELIAQNTLFGYIIGGGNIYVSGQNSFNVKFDFNVDQSLQKFWELESVPENKMSSSTEQKCEDLFATSTYRNPDGRFVVKLPFVDNPPTLGSSLPQAISRFLSMERKLQSNPHLKTEYVKFMREFRQLNHMEELTDADKSIPESRHYYLPHHAVLKESSLTTKVRVVFDGSAKSTTSVSLNDILLVGPTVQPELLSILMRFRLHRIAFASDIEKMYRQVKVYPEDANYQRIVWRNSPTEPLIHYKLNTVTYGTASASFLATRSLKEVANLHQDSNPKMAAVISNDFYVDDILSGADTIGEAVALRNNLQKSLGDAGFSLQKWASNSQDFLQTITTKNSATVIDMFKDNSHKVLGLHWNTEKDCFIFKVNIIHDPNDTQTTKRKFLSDGSRLFDPLGWLSPVIIRIKILFQKLWFLKLDWDDKLPTETAESWSRIKQELYHIERIQIPRYNNFNQTSVEIHGFCDASKNAYAAAIYLRSMDNNGVIHSNLVTAKTKVSPTRPLTIPRLELCAAHLLAKLTNSVIDILQLKDVPVFSWTDSEIVLHWLSQSPTNWEVFVSNRSSQIHQLLPQSIWQHVGTKSNPCDCASRGIKPDELKDHALWWKGPLWLNLPQDKWPPQQSRKYNGDQSLLEKKRNSKLHHNQAQINVQHPVQELFVKHSSFRKIQRILAFCKRFITNAKLKRGINRVIPFDINKILPIRCEEYKGAEVYCWKWAQNDVYKEEIAQLAAGVNLKKSSILSLSPFLDKEGVLRVGGRLKNSTCAYNARHQVILPKVHTLSNAILSKFHDMYLHPTAANLFHLSRQSVWIINGKVLASKITRTCMRCFRLNAKSKPQQMGDLPAVRTNPARCFSKVGVDFAGPIQVASKKGRGAKLTKAYVAVFVCMVVKAVHLELVSDLSTDAFLAALRRFVSRRGLPSDIYSDNATNFKGAKNKLPELNQMMLNSEFSQKVSSYLIDRGVQWHFIPPASPSMGGLWEASVKCMKSHLIRATSLSNLTFEETSTLLCEIEAILNSRPLTPISSDPKDEMPLTPAHFLLNVPLGALPDEPLENIPDNRLNRYQNIQKRVQGYWRRFSREYLHTLQRRQKWDKKEQNLRTGDLVYIQDENTFPLHWPMGRITDVHPGTDGLVRVVTVRTSKTIVKRPVTKILKLPINVD